MLNEFISQVEHKRFGGVIDEKGKNALNNKQVMNCNGMRQIDQERKKQEAKIKMKNKEANKDYVRVPIEENLVDRLLRNI